MAMTSRHLSYPLHRAALTLLVMAALMLQGIPLHRAEAVAATPHSIATSHSSAATCHDAAVTPGQTQHMPKPARTDAFACCATFACGMLLQALPPEPLPGRMVFAATFDRLPGAGQPRGRDPAPAWRPPDTLI